MKPDRSPEEGRICPVCGTRLPDDSSIRRCPRCGARALQWAERPQPDPGVVLFNARLAGLMGGGLVAMMGLLVLGYRFPLPWYVALSAIALPVAGYALFGAGAQNVPRSWRTHYLVGVLALDSGLLVATMAAVMGLLRPLTLAGTAVAVGALVWPLIHRAISSSAARGDT